MNAMTTVMGGFVGWHLWKERISFVPKYGKLRHTARTLAQTRFGAAESGSSCAVPRLAPEQAPLRTGQAGLKLKRHVSSPILPSSSIVSCYLPWISRKPKPIPDWLLIPF
jgi:hypothetical protein